MSIIITKKIPSLCNFFHFYFWKKGIFPHSSAEINAVILPACFSISSMDHALLKTFQKDPVKALEKVLNVDLPDDLINPVIDGIKAKIAVDNIEDVAGNLFKKLF